MFNFEIYYIYKYIIQIKMKKKKTIKLSESQANQLLTEDYPFSYFGNESTPQNGNSKVTVNTHFESPDVDPVNTTSGDVANAISGYSWLNKGFGNRGFHR